MEQLVFTPSAVLDLLTSIDELSEYEIGISETLDGKLQVTVGDSTYQLDDTPIDDVSVDEVTLDEIVDINMNAYAELEDSDRVDISDKVDIKSGVLKEIGKTILVGGLVRLTSKLLR